ncbi:MAG TPA: acyltransferase family protein [Solirubrobacterales bacterium]|nr:acyltransferase family protein [Solirubrobacterales bacterium]
MTVPQDHRLPYMPGIDALRALSVLAVFLYHAGIGWMPGGFLGVDVFFVISGYLITALLLSEYRRDGHVSVGRFWLRRARRLLPAVGVLIAATMTLAAIFVPDEVAALRDDAIASLLYVTNWHFIFTEQSYFEQFERPSLFRHLWSLAIEEQFYLLWPLALAAGMTLLGRRRLLIGVLAGAVLSAGLMAVLFDPDGDVSRVYYGTDTRAVGLLLGVALAVVWHPNLLRGRTGRHAGTALDAIGLVSLLVVLWTFFNVNDFDPGLYQGGFLVLAFFTALLVGVMAHPASRLGSLVALPPVLWLGLRSYSFYLWHWPVLALTRPDLDVPIHRPWLTILQLGAVLVLADLSYRYVEQPFRGRAPVPLKLPRLPAIPKYGRPALAAAVLLVVALIGWSGIVPTQERVQASVAAATGTEEASVEAAGTGPPDVLALGDSVMVGAGDALAERLGPRFTLSAAIGRQAAEFVDLIEGYRAAGRLPDKLIIQMGNNGPIREGQLDEIGGAVADVDEVFLMNVEVPLTWEGPNNDKLAGAAEDWPNAELLDWNAVVNSRGGLTFDGVHLTPEGVEAYTDLIVDAAGPAPGEAEVVRASRGDGAEPLPSGG